MPPSSKTLAALRQADEIGMLVSAARRAMWNDAAKRLDSQGESMLAWQLMRHLMRGDADTQRGLVSVTTQHPAGVSRGLAELESRGLIRRRRDAEDRRRMAVEVTDEGRAWFARVHPDVQRGCERALAPLDANERRTLHVLLSRLAPPREK